MNRVSVASLAAVSVASVWWAPAAVAVGPLRRVLLPRLVGSGTAGRVALTFDDGPCSRSTPRFVEALRTLAVRATFFVLGERLAADPGLGRALVEAGHELAVHGWDHRCLARRSPTAAFDDLIRTRDLIAEVTGFAPRWWRPPYGVATAPLLCASNRLGMAPVLWSHWGRDWGPGATARSVAATATTGLGAGAVVLLHDAPAGRAGAESWRAAVGALPLLVGYCRARGLVVGPLSDHVPAEYRG